MISSFFLGWPVIKVSVGLSYIAPPVPMANSEEIIVTLANCLVCDADKGGSLNQHIAFVSLFSHTAPSHSTRSLHSSPSHPLWKKINKEESLGRETRSEL